MSAVTPRFLIAFLIIFFIFSCKENKKASHGLKNVPVSAYTYKGLVEKTIQLKFKSFGTSPTTIIAEVEIPYNYQYPLTYEWKLGDQVKLSSGQIKGEVALLQQNKKIEISIDVTGFKSDATRFIRFEIMGTNSQRKIYADGIYSSDITSSFESIVQEVENYKKHNPKDSE